MKVIGLTGGIGAGKSAATRVLQELGARVIDVDRVSHEAYRPGTDTWKAVVDFFGDGVLQPNGEIDRKKLGEIVFADSAALAQLNAIVHPQTARMLEQRLEDFRHSGIQVAIVEAAVLVEAKWNSMVDEIWVITAPYESVLERLAKRGLNEEQIRQRMDMQFSPKEREGHAQCIIDNSGDLKQLRAEIETVWYDRVTRERR